MTKANMEMLSFGDVMAAEKSAEERAVCEILCSHFSVGNSVLRECSLRDKTCIPSFLIKVGSVIGV